MESRVGWVNENPITQERGTVLIDPMASDGVFAGLLELGPDARVVGEHFHPGLHERFRVLSGTLAMKLDGVQSTVTAGEMADIPAGAVHDWWNVGGGPASVLVWVDPGNASSSWSAPSSASRAPAARTPRGCLTRCSSP